MRVTNTGDVLALLLVAFVAAACGGCGATSGLFGEHTDTVVGGSSLGGAADGSSVSVQHAFTDAGAEAARKGAAKHCAYRKRVAVKTSGACTMTTCTSHYQCMDPKDAEAFQADPPRK